jgi:ribose-phosphate pyrophosphokinase
MNRVLIALPGNEKLCHLLAPLLGADISPLDTRHFPDGETYVRLDPSVAGKQVIFVCTLDRPDDKFLRLVFSCAAARDLEAASVGLVAPYLAYMRQDKPFHPGEAVTAHHFASTLSPWIDWAGHGRPPSSSHPPLGRCLRHARRRGPCSTRCRLMDRH